jgi:NADH-quinone oxidoreductase subunit M
MQSTLPYLSLAIWVPIAFGALVLAVGNVSRADLVRRLSLLGAVISLLVTLPVVSLFDPAAQGCWR